MAAALFRGRCGLPLAIYDRIQRRVVLDVKVLNE
jgi:hypothetical protein